jgi:hypothetical protein
MTVRVVQTSAERPCDVVLIYNADSAIDPSVKKAWPEATIGNETMEAFKSHYSKIGPGEMTPLVDAVKRLGLEWTDVRNLVLVGFSEGCQALRTALLSGAFPSGIIAIDGIHSNLGTNPTGHEDGGDVRWFHVQPFRTFAEFAKGETRVLTITHSDIVPWGKNGGPASTTRLARLILAPDVETPMTTITAGVSKFHLVSGFRQGDFSVLGYSGTDKAAHSYQLLQVLPDALSRARTMLQGKTFTPLPGSGSSPKLGPADVVPWKGPEAPTPPPFPPTLPVTPVGHPPPVKRPPTKTPPPQPKEPPLAELPRSQIGTGGSGGGAAAVFVALALAAAVAMKRRKG